MAVSRFRAIPDKVAFPEGRADSRRLLAQKMMDPPTAVPAPLQCEIKFVDPQEPEVRFQKLSRRGHHRIEEADLVEHEMDERPLDLQMAISQNRAVPDKAMDPAAKEQVRKAFQNRY
jgi:hypothetical protein